MTFQKLLVLLGLVGSAALLTGALGFQYIGELPPCAMCYWQRYPHAAAIVVGALALTLSGIATTILAWLGAIAAFATSGIGFYHAGVEQGWWQGPTTCTAGDISNLSGEDLMNQIMSAPLVRCDDIPWEMFGISMAGWNGIASLLLGLIWVAAARHGRRS